MRCRQADMFQATGREPDTLVPLAAARLPGRQCIHRAELTAVLWVFQNFSKACVYTDSLDTHQWVDKLHRDPQMHIDPLHPDIDLLLQLQQLLTPAHVTRKVKAHQDCASVSGLLPCYWALGNRAADKLAVETNEHLLPEIGRELETFAQLFLDEVHRMVQFYHYLLRLNEARAKAVTDEDTIQEHSLEPLHLAEQLKTYVAGDWTCPREVTEDWLSCSAWGLQVFWALQEWLCDCVWPEAATSTPGPVPLGISWVEICVAVALHHNQWLPVLRTRSDGKQYVTQPRSTEEALQIGTCLGEQAWVMSQIFTHYQSLVPQLMTPSLKRGKVLSLTTLGYDLRLTGIDLRPSFSKQNLVITALQQFEPTAVGASHFSRKVSTQLGGLPELPFSDFEPWEEDLRIFSVPFEIRKKAATGAQTAVLRQRKRCRQG
eukprot:Skav234508  [mRNA]  locus=scaffold1613:281194:282486:- [translate_table: standard]